MLLSSVDRFRCSSVLAALAAAIALAACSGSHALPVADGAGTGAGAPAGADLFALRAGSGKPTGVVIPMYVYPGKVWDAAIAAKLAHPNVPMALIVNVNNGPGTKQDPQYVKYVEKAQKAGIWVLGYVYTSYGKRSQADVDAAMTQWYDRYHPDGIFIDEMAANNPGYYRASTAYAHAHSLWFVMGNPGANAAGNSGPDVIVFFENKGYPSHAFLSQPAHTKYGKSRWGYIAGAVAYDAARIKASAGFVNYLYVTDGKEPECYCALPTYFVKLVALLDTLT